MKRNFGSTAEPQLPRHENATAKNAMEHPMTMEYMGGGGQMGFGGNMVIRYHAI